MSSQIWLVAKNIYRTRVKGAGFWALVLSPFIVAAISLGIGFIIGSSSNATPKLAVVNNASLHQLLQADGRLNADLSDKSSLDEARTALDKGDIDGYLTESDGHYKITTSSSGVAKFDEKSFQQALNQSKMMQEAQRLGLSADNLKSLLSPASLSIETAGQASGDARRGANAAVGTVSSILIFMFLMLYVGVIGQEIGNEKSSRIMEILLAASSAKVQYYGKILGVIMLALTQIGLYVLGFGVAYPFVKNQETVKQLSGLLAGIDLNFGLYLIAMSLVGTLGYLFLASIVASLVNEQAQVQQATQPIAFLSMIGYIGGIAGASVPSNLILKVMSFIPFISPTLMTSRFAIQFSSATEAWISLGLQLLATILIAKTGEKIYARNVISYSDEKIMKQLLANIRGK
ncbi:ABC transporter permease [Lactococcus termiticola]|uniref:ABC transporter permease protein n=1 Tax=Lactococcus termiticola TaxID=2169526 RepID=A0A2R5HF28_9LACT|nr:ABC transporter permease [Lactococcus termiticola]GBG96669.1 ABC transporter permease protein [Lactococcus termiticola]